MTDTNELRRLLAAATPTPWAVSHGDESWEVVQTKPDGTPDFGARRTAFDDGSAGGEYGPSCNTLTRDLIVAAVNALPSLLDELDALRAEIERLREDSNATAMDLVDERDDARADLREAEQELLAARARIKQLEGCLVDRMAEALDKLPSPSDARYMLVLKRKDTP